MLLVAKGLKLCYLIFKKDLDYDWVHSEYLIKKKKKINQMSFWKYINLGYLTTLASSNFGPFELYEDFFLIINYTLYRSDPIISNNVSNVGVTL